MAQCKTISDWVAFLTKTDLPVLKKSKLQIEKMKTRAESLTVRDISQVALDDPMMTLRAMSLLQQFRRSSSITSEVTTFGRVIMMVGIGPFLAHFDHVTAIEDHLADDPNALDNVLNVIDRSRYASRYAFDFAGYRFDIDRYEVQIATLLYSTAEIALWCFAPDMMRKIRALALRYRHTRSESLQEHILGFTFNELQLAMSQAWKLPELLVSLMDKAYQNNPRVRTVTVATDLARHSANGLGDPALPDDYRNVSQLLNQDMEKVLMHISSIRQQVKSVRHEDETALHHGDSIPLSHEEIEKFERAFPEPVTHPNESATEPAEICPSKSSSETST